MKFLFVVLLTFTLSGIACAQPQKKCFVNGGLKDENRVYLTINGSQVAGEFVVARDYDPASRETYAISGTKKGNSLTIRFAAGKTPDALPRNLENFIWTLVTGSDKELLQVKFYGKNYNTNKSQIYTAQFDACEASG